MPSTEPRTYARTLYEARLDAECYAVSHELHARLFRRLRLVVRIAVGVSGSTAFGGWLAESPAIAGISGLVLALLVALEQAVDTSEKIARHRVSGMRYAELRRDSIRRDMSLAEFDDRLEALKAEDEAGIDALLVRAFNRVVQGAGRSDHKIPESRWQRFVAFFA